MTKVLLAGISGYLGSYIAQELREKGYFVRGIVRNPDYFRGKGIKVNEIISAELTQPHSTINVIKQVNEGDCREIRGKQTSRTLISIRHGPSSVFPVFLQFRNETITATVLDQSQHLYKLLQLL